MRPLVWPLLFGAIAGTSACARPARPPVPTMDSPSDVVATSFCVVSDGAGGFVIDPPNTCRETDPTSLLSRAVVANSGRSQIQVLDLDRIIPTFVDYDTGTPGNTGISVGDGPNVVAISDRFPALALAGSSRELQLTATDIISGRAIGAPLQLRESLHRLKAIPGSPLFVGIQRRNPTLTLFRLDIACDGQAGVHRIGCDTEATLSRVFELSLAGPPSDVVAASDGRVWVAFDERNTIDALDLGLDESGQPTCTDTCVVDRLSIFRSCWDGLDNDGDGLVDTDDPQCFEVGGEEAVADGAPACSDGIDNDGDGAIDADDPDCAGASDASESSEPADECADGYDNDLDGSADSADSSCATNGTEFERARPIEEAGTALIPQCSDGIDNDGDGLIDWPDDTDCYSAASSRELPLTNLTIARLALTDEEDLLLALIADPVSLLVFDALTSERIDPNPLTGAFEGLGIPVVSGRGLGLVTYAFDLAVETLSDGRVVRVTDRVAHAIVAQGFIDPVLLDRTYRVEDAEGSTVEEFHEPRYSRFDFDRQQGFVRILSCDFPREALIELGDLGAACTDEIFPQPQVVDAEALGETGSTDSWLTDPAGAYVGLLRRPVMEVNEERSDLVDTDVVDDYRMTQDVYEMIWEGVLPNSNRDDVLVTDEGEWATVIGLDPCGRDRDPCSVGLDLSECSEARALCDGGIDLCEQGYDICRLCPQACAGAIDFCALGVIPGDRLVFERRTAQLNDPACAPFVTGIGDGLAATTVSAEYEITAVQPDRVRISPVPDAADAGLIDTLPPAACTTSLLEVEVRAGNAWVWRGRNSGYHSQMVANGDVCVTDPERAQFSGRPLTGKPWETPQGYTIHVVDGTEPPVRDFRFIFDIRSGFVNAQEILGFLLLGPSNSGATHTQSRRGHRLVFTDDAQSFVWAYDGSNFRSLTGPLP